MEFGTTDSCAGGSVLNSNFLTVYMTEVSFLVGIVISIIFTGGNISLRNKIILSLLPSVTITLITIWLRIYYPADVSKDVLILSIVSFLLFPAIIYIFLRQFDRIYADEEINKPIIEFTNYAKEIGLKLFGGDLNFFGYVSSMDKNEQFFQLRNKKFHSIQVLCDNPKNISDPDKKTEAIVRYGKLFCTFVGVVELRYYGKAAPDLSIRGRIKYDFNGTPRVLLYHKIAPGKFKPIEYTPLDRENNFYVELFDHLWKHATKDEAIKNDCEAKYKALEREQAKKGQNG